MQTSRLETLRSASAQRVRREEGPPSTNGSPYSKEELKRRNNIYFLALLIFQIGGFLAFCYWIVNGGGPKP